MAIRTAVVFLALGLDTLAVSLGLGLAGLARDRWLRVGVTFALFEGLMPAFGLLIGRSLSGILGSVATFAAGGMLIAIGALEVKEALSDDEREVDADRLARMAPLLLTGLSVSLDEMAIGFSLGVLKAPIGMVVAAIAAQAFALTGVGLFLGRRFGARLGERAELLGGILLVVVGMMMVVGKA